MKYEASCTCGQLKLKYDGEIKKSSICHCYDCQKRTGSVFGAQVRVLRSQVSTEGLTTRFERKGDSGGTVAFHFCPKCGSTVFWEADGLPDSYFVAVGAFADVNFPAPTFSVYEDRMHRWVAMPASVVDRLA